MRNKVSKFRRCSLFLLCALSVLSLGLTASAAEAGGANQAVVSAMTSAASDMIATATAIIPAALGVVTLGLVITFGIKLFRRIAK